MIMEQKYEEVKSSQKPEYYLWLNIIDLCLNMYLG